MKKIVLLAGILGLFSVTASAQCTNVTLNWDYLDYFPFSGNYTSSAGYLPSNSFSRTQNFAFGRQRLTIAHAYNDANALGENSSHTGEGGSYGTGDDINFNGNGTITFTFDANVTNLRFSVYDLDGSQSLGISATNDVGTNQNISVARSNGSSSLVIVGSGTTAPSVTSALVGNTTNSSTMSTVNIDVAGPVRTVTLTFSGTAGDFWISDITACASASFPTNYYSVSQPFTGMPGYVLHAFDNSVYALNPANGVTRLLFTDPMDLGGTTNINSMAYDPYNRVLYYVYSLTGTPGNNRMLRKYDFNTKTISTVLSDISSTTYGTGVGIPVVTSTAGNPVYGGGVESGAAAFYDGSLYLGIETSNKGSSGPLRTSSREAVIWRIDFDASNVPYRASQVWALPIDNGSGTLLHDWSDFVINNGVLYDYDGAGTTTQTNIYHTNMVTGNTTNYPTPSGFTPGQPTVDWAGNVYQMHAISPSTTPYIAPYNMNGTIGTRTNVVSTPMYTPAIPSLGDAAEAFRPLVDFGDAPATYDPVATAPAIHEEDANLHLGTSMDIEWLTRGQSALANNDNFDNGLAYVSTFSPVQDQYLIQVNVFNNTGSNATLIGWLDYNGNGVFDAAEGRSVTVPSSATPQNVYVYWSGALGSTLPNSTYTYLRLRLTSASNGMTTSNASGYFANGEVEDYRVFVNTYPLQTTLLTFDAQCSQSKKVDIDWTTAAEKPGVRYELERSADGASWTVINRQAACAQDRYRHTDAQPLPLGYYRLRMIAADGTVSLSEIRKITLQTDAELITYPNPAREVLNVRFTSDLATTAQVQLVDVAGRVVYRSPVMVRTGQNSFTLPMDRRWPEGMYTLVFRTPERVSTRQVIVKKP
jgi:hypothetical protein